jgi:cellulose synthase operon protein C
VQLKIKFNHALDRGELAPGDRRLWVLRSLALRIIKQSNPIWQVEIYYKRLLIGLSAIAIAVWLLAASSLFLWLDRQPHNQVGWLDLAAPWRWSGLRAKYGDTAVMTALDELKARDYASAFYNLRVGVARSPANVAGRLTLAALLVGHDPIGAVTLLEEGLPVCGPDPQLLSGLFSLYARFQIQTHALEVIGRWRAETKITVPPESRFLLERTQAALFIQLGRYAEAEAVLAAIKTATEKDAAMVQDLQLEILLRTGRAAAAREFMVQHPRPESDANQRRAAEIAIALDDSDALQGTLRRMRARSPNDPGIYLYAFQAWHRMKRRSFCDATEREFYQLFPNNEGALQALAALAVNLDVPEVITRAQRVAVSTNHSPFAFRVHQTELALRRGETEQATRFLRNWESNIDTLKASQRFYPELIKRLTYAAFTGTPTQISTLLDYIADNRGQAPLSVYNLVILVLEKSGHFAGVGQALQAGIRLYPLSEPLLNTQSRLAAQVSAASAVNQPEAPISASAATVPTTAKAALAQLDAFLEQDALAATRDLLRAIRAQKPAWQDGNQPDLARREITLSFLTLDQMSGLTATRSYLDRYHTEEDLLQLVAVAAQLLARDRPAEARLLHDEIAGSRYAGEAVKRSLRTLKLTDDLAAVAASQAAALAALDRYVLTQEWVQAGRILKYLETNPPAWLPMATVEIKVREVQIRLGLDQRPLALAALKELTGQPGAPRSAAFKLVRDFLARGETETGRLLAREIARLLPDNPAALKLLKEAEAPIAPPG